MSMNGSSTGAARSRSSSTASNMQQEPERPMSIASLRSKFESLAAGASGDGAGSETKSRSRSGSQVRPISGVASVAGDGRKSSTQPIEASTSTSRPSTPTPRSPKPPPALPPQAASRPHSLLHPTLPSSSISPSIPPKPVLAQSSLPETRPADVAPPSSTPSSPQPHRRPAPAVPPKPASEVITPATSDHGSDDGQPAPPVSVKSLRERFNAPVSTAAPAETSSMALKMQTQTQTSSSLPKSPSLNGSLHAAEDMSRRRSAPSIKRTSTGGTITSPTSPAVQPPADVESEPTIPRTSSPTTVDGDTPTQRGGPPALPRPTSPALRAPSPKPPEPDRASKPPPRRSPSPTPPLSRSTSSPHLMPDQPAPASTASAPPQLPARKSTLSSPSPSASPPLPGLGSGLGSNRPSPALPTTPSFQSGGDVQAPPPLPSRDRAATVSKAEGVAPPRLPTRNATLAVPAAPPAPIPARAPTIAPPSPQRSRDISVDGFIAPPPPMRSAMPTADYQPPPPPVRGGAATSPPRREGTRSSADAESDDDDDDEPAPLTGLTAAAKRMLEDYPDSTHANRRPPHFVPDVRLPSTHHVHAFAAFGRHVCTGSHHVKVFDTLMSESPIFVVELRETGLEFRVKDPKVTAMCFRPSGCEADEGRFLWCGTKDGHLWELDIKTGQVTDTRAYVHASPVTGIFRHKNWLISLEETGKAHVFEVGKLHDGKHTENDRLIPQLSRTIRVTDKYNFAKLVCGRLWVSSGPANRSTTSAASKGPTIRVYEPCTDGSMPAPKTMFTSEWTGAVTSATIMPFRQDVVYLGHEGGFVSIWSAADLTCLQVLKISASDILALEGVGERLWAGNRKGQIHVYNIDEKPWQVTNVWTAHPDNALQTLLVDPWSVQHAGRFTLWSLARDALRAWDGLRSVDWIDHEMIHRQSQYSSFRQIKLLVCTWNIDSARPSDLAGSEANSRFLDDLLHSVDSPDVIVFGFQEVIPLTDKKLTAKTLLFGGKNKEAGAMADKVSHSYRQWLDKLQLAVRMAAPDTPYVKVHSESLVGLFTCVFVKVSEQHALRDINVCTVKRGIGGIYGNKGAIVARMVVDDTSLCFINVHLAAGQSQRAARNADLGGIMEDKAIFPAAEELPFVNGGDGTAILDHELVVLNGDLNYRIDQRREAVLSNIQAEEWMYLLEHDQLRKEMRGNHAFRLRSFEEAQIAFPPTYKYNPGTNDYDSSEKRRIPAWCDRILWNKSPHIESISYRRYEPTVSDHKPVSAGFKLRIKAVDPGKMVAVQREVNAEWAKKEMEVLEKMAEAYEKLL